MALFEKKLMQKNLLTVLRENSSTKNKLFPSAYSIDVNRLKTENK